ncbi:MAG: zinc ribbon domain-containing protein [Spirochaetales bacterium]|nr:MAG: zinc ribbon domain-containing protein [Spirochaetales bacterium]
MPIFEYACKKCGSRFDVLVRGDEKVACSSCGSSSLTKLFSPFAVQKLHQAASPVCSDACSGGFNRGACGSGMCGSR